ncbi:MAG: T9SS type A sorting domain-containing protein [Calditrichaceae bacterium]|nr:T9SS type A sorting domain-containing protein [Calditrichaceae bacterium]
MSITDVTQTSKINHFVEFNASGLAGGVYLYRIQAGNYAETRRLLLQK